jgi:hypothetical protein
MVLLNTFFPKFRFEYAPQMSPPRERRSCAAEFNRSQSATKLPLESVQLRVTFCAMRDVGFAIP